MFTNNTGWVFPASDAINLVDREVVSLVYRKQVSI